MSAVVDVISDAVGSVVEAVGDVVEGAIDVVKDVGRAIDDYVIQPILDDPLTAIATAAAAAYLGPAAASYFGTSATVGAGIAAGAGNLAAGLAQGEEFGDALKGATLAGVATFAGGELLGKPSVNTPTPTDSLDDFLASKNNFADVDVSGVSGAPSITTPEVTPSLSQPSLTQPAEVTSPLSTLNTAPETAAPNLSSGLDTSFTPDYSLSSNVKSGYGLQAPGFTPADSFDLYGNANYSLTPSGVSGGPGLQFPDSPNLARMGGGQGLTVDVEGLPEFRYSDASLDPSLRGQTDSWVGENGKTYGLETPDVTISSSGISPTPETITYDPNTNMGSPSIWDRMMSGDYANAAKDIGTTAFDWVKENPWTAGLGALTVLGGGLGGGTKATGATPKPGSTKDANFGKSLDLYNYMRDRNNYTGDISRYGQTGQKNAGEHSFFENSRFVPVQPAKMGGLIQMKQFAQGGFAQQDPRMQDPRMRDPRQMQMMQAMARQQPLAGRPGPQGMPLAGRPGPQGMPPRGALGQMTAPQGMQQAAPQVAQRPRDPRTAYYQYGNPPVQEKARGGLSSIHSMRIGGGADGRSDDVPAVLSDGEYVMDAETVAMLGNGSSKAGAAKLDQMRSKLRQHKGKALASGKISPDAKSPLSYLKGA